MLDFRRHRQAPAARWPSGERRLLMLLCGAALVIFLVLQVAGPLRRQAAAPAAPAGAQLAALAGPDRTDSDDAARVDLPRPDQLFPGVRRDYLAEVRDDAKLRRSEADAWFHLLALLEQTDPAKLEEASVGRVGFLQLDEQPEAYRGRLVSLAGTVRSAKRLTAPENAYGVKQYYQLWLQPERSEPELVVVYCLELPAGFPLGTELDAPCSTTGFFFKRWAYLGASGPLTAPLILARSVSWTPPPEPAAAPEPGESLVISLGAAMLVAILLITAVVGRSRRNRRTTTDATPTIVSPGDFDNPAPDEHAPY